jgi:cell wall-associated NlpC family hydrolase
VVRGVKSFDAPRALQPLILGALRDSIVALALSQLGMPYVLGGTTPGGFDCSGLVRWVTAQMHMAVPRTARLQALAGTPVPRDALQPGDLLAFGDGNRISHVGIYVGHGRFVHASSAAGRVVVSPLDRRPSPLIRPMRGARRLLASAAAGT